MSYYPYYYGYPLRSFLYHSVIIPTTTLSSGAVPYRLKSQPQDFEDRDWKPILPPKLSSEGQELRRKLPPQEQHLNLHSGDPEYRLRLQSNHRSEDQE